MTPVGRALCDRFEEVSRAELIRLKKKIAALPAETRAAVEAATIEVTQGIAESLDARLAALDGAGVDDVVARIFAVAPDDQPACEGE